MINTNGPVYHESQSLQLCALHALNCLLQGPVFTKNKLDEICTRLSPERTVLNPHKSYFGMGNYDVNVLVAALEERGYSAAWFDNRKSASVIDLKHVIGFILNIPSAPKIGFITVPFITRSHWIAVKEINGQYYNLDSKLEKPQLIGDSSELVEFLNNALRDPDKQVFVIVEKTIDASKAWLTST